MTRSCEFEKTSSEYLDMDKIFEIAREYIILHSTVEELVVIHQWRKEYIKDSKLTGFADQVRKLRSDVLGKW